MSKPEGLSWQSNPFGQDSIEITTDDIYNQSDLTERIEEAEKRFSTSSITTSYFSSERFNYPAIYRILFMGGAEPETKKKILDKLGQGFVHVLLDQQKTWGDKPVTPFREIKHNLVPLNNYYFEKNIVSASYEEYGVSIIEADFTWYSTVAECSEDSSQLLLHYAWKQCPNPSELPSAHLGNSLPEEFEGTMCSEKTPNGIDLCVYVYDESNKEKIRSDMQLLYKIRKLGIYVLPLTLCRSEHIKNEFSKILTYYQVLCLDLSNIQVGQQPSFQFRGDRLCRIQGMECRQSNRPAVASYQILAIEQFFTIENINILELLKRTRDREVERDENKKQDYNILLKENIKSEENYDDSAKKANRKIMVSTIAVVVLLFVLYIIHMPPKIWSASFQLNQETGLFYLLTKDYNNQLAWASVDPMIWLNDQILVPIQKTTIGNYQLLLNTPLQSQKLSFYVNTTDTNILYFDSRTTIYVQLASVVRKDKILENQVQSDENPAFKETIGLYEKTVRYFVFSIENLKYLKDKIFTG